MRKILAYVIARFLTSILMLIRQQTPARRLTIYLAGVALAVLVIVALAITVAVVPSALVVLKDVWIIVGPVALLVVAGMAGPNVTGAEGEN